MDRSVTVYAWLFDPIDAGPFGRHCLIPEKMRLYRLGSADKLLRKLLSARIGTQWWRSYRSICCLASIHQMLSIRPATRQWWSRQEDTIKCSKPVRAPSWSMPWLSSDAGRSQCYPCYVDLIGDLFYQAPEECNFLPDLMSLYFSLPVSNDIYTISREPSGSRSPTILRWAAYRVSSPKRKTS